MISLTFIERSCSLEIGRLSHGTLLPTKLEKAYEAAVALTTVEIEEELGKNW
jgi:hypothetical protein